MGQPNDLYDLGGGLGKKDDGGWGADARGIPGEWGALPGCHQKPLGPEDFLKVSLHYFVDQGDFRLVSAAFPGDSSAGLLEKGLRKG